MVKRLKGERERVIYFCHPSQDVPAVKKRLKLESFFLIEKRSNNLVKKDWTFSMNETG